MAQIFLLASISYSERDRNELYKNLRPPLKFSVQGPGLRVDDYYKDIEAARDERRISGGPKEDLHSHFKGLHHNNTRPLSLVGEQLFRIIISIPRQREARIMELGPGAGIACTNMSKIAEELREEIVIDTIGLTPIAPRFRLLLGYRQLDNLAVEADDEEIKRLYKEGTDKLHALSLELAFALHSRGVKVFDVLEKPFIRHQHIGDFGEVVVQDKYDFIYEESGAFWQIINNNSRQAFDKAIALLDENGIFYFNGGRLRSWDRFKNLPEELIFVTWPDDVLIVHRDGIYGQRLKSNQTKAIKVSDKAYRFESFEEALGMLGKELTNNRAIIEQKSRKGGLQSI